MLFKRKRGLYTELVRNPKKGTVEIGLGNKAGKIKHWVHFDNEDQFGEWVNRLNAFKNSK